jgi:hypothetical protein
MIAMMKEWHECWRNEVLDLVISSLMLVYFSNILKVSFTNLTNSRLCTSIDLIYYGIT